MKAAIPHEKPVYGISIHPNNDNVFATAGEDGRILLFDTRENLTQGNIIWMYIDCHCSISILRFSSHGTAKWWFSLSHVQPNEPQIYGYS